MEGLELLPTLISAFKDGQWSIFASAIIMVLVWGVTKAPGLSDLIKGRAKVWVAAVSGMLTATAMTILTDEGDWFVAIGNGFSVGLGATGLFELIRRKINKLPIDADGDGELDELN